MLIDRQLADLTTPDAEQAATPPPPPHVDPAAASTATQRLAVAKDNLAGLRLLGRTDDHPDVKAMQRLIRDLQKQADAEALAQPVSTAGDRGVGCRSGVPARTASPPVAGRKRISSTRSSRLNRPRKRRGFAGVAADYQERLDAVPERESEMVDLTRDYGTQQSIYTNLLAKKEESAISANLERRQIGEQFKVLDQARLPERPFSPDRRRLDLEGMGIGFAIGLALVGLLEYRDTTFKTDDEITGLLGLPVLAVVPLMRSQGDRRRAGRLTWLLNLGLGGTVVGCLLVLAYSFIR